MLYAELQGCKWAGGSNNHPTTRHSHIVLLERVKQILIVELTVPFEPNTETAHESKTEKYKMLLSELKRKGYKALFPCHRDRVKGER